MRVIAATFQDERAAERVLGRLRDAYQLRGSDAALAPLGDAGDPAGEPIILAGRFYDERVPTVRTLIEREGGHVVIDVDEAATRRRATPAPAAPADQGSREPSRLKARGELTRMYF